jgi:hypothetical protein
VALIWIGLTELAAALDIPYPVCRVEQDPTLVRSDSSHCERLRDRGAPPRVDFPGVGSRTQSVVARGARQSGLMGLHPPIVHRQAPSPDADELARRARNQSEIERRRDERDAREGVLRPLRRELLQA